MSVISAPFLLTYLLTYLLIFIASSSTTPVLGVKLLLGRLPIGSARCFDIASRNSHDEVYLRSNSLLRFVVDSSCKKSHSKFTANRNNDAEPIHSCDVATAWAIFTARYRRLSLQLLFFFENGFFIPLESEFRSVSNCIIILMALVYFVNYSIKTKYRMFKFV